MVPKRQLTVRIVFRNYKPLHMIYESLVSNPPKDIEYIVPKSKTALGRFMFIYRRYKQYSLVKKATAIINRLIFSRDDGQDKVDIHQYVNMISSSPKAQKVPYIVDVERASSLTGFSQGSDIANQAIMFLTNKNCKTIVCMSKAAKGTLKELVGEKWDSIKEKVKIIYPTIPLPALSKANRSIIKDKNKLNLLFVGNQSGRKGLTDLLEAIKILNKNHQKKLELFVVSSDAKDLVKQYDLPNVHVFKPEYTKKDMLKKFFIPADLFMFPTRGDTYGLAVVDALASGTPVVATRQFALRELISHQRDGFLIDVKEPALDKYLYLPRHVVKKINSHKTKYPEVTKQIIGLVERFVNDKSELGTWSNNARTKFRGNNILSISKRNSDYKKVYDNVVKETV